MPDHITYRETRPHPALAPFIDAYWTVTGENSGEVPDKVLPDACVDIIVNTGPRFESEIGAMQMNTGQAYLIGTMTRYKEMVRPAATRLMGIRFKPGGFPFFYDYRLLKDTSDKTIEFDPTLAPPGPDIPLLDRFFYNRLITPRTEILTLISSIRAARGNISVGQLARRSFVTIRQLERLFALHLDITPKEFINITRFQYAYDEIRRRSPTKRLLDIACEYGYYDHAHLTNAIRQYTGTIPSAL